MARVYENMLNLAGTSFLTQETLDAAAKKQIKLGDSVVVLINRDEGHPAARDDDFEIIHAETKLSLGWIPQLATIKKYTGEAFKAEQPGPHAKQILRYKVAQAIREQIVTNENINEIQTVGIVCDLMFKDGGNFNRDHTGKLVAVSVSI